MPDEASEAVDGLDKALVEAVGHRVGYAIYRVLTERPASARELADLLSQPRSTVGDQLRKLIAGGLVESAGEEARRGTTLVHREHRPKAHRSRVPTAAAPYG